MPVINLITACAPKHVGLVELSAFLCLIDNNRSLPYIFLIIPLAAISYLSNRIRFSQNRLVSLLIHFEFPSCRLFIFLLRLDCVGWIDLGPIRANLCPNGKRVPISRHLSSGTGQSRNYQAGIRRESCRENNDCIGENIYTRVARANC
jgi:hypothetical protein